LGIANRARGRGIVLGMTVLGVIAVIGVAGPVSQLVEARLHPTGSSLAEQQLRLALIPASIDYANTHRILGSGPGTFTVLPIYYPIEGVQTPLIDDNAFTTEIVELGYPGVILFVASLAAFSYAWWRRRGSPLYAASLGAMAAFVVCSATVDSSARDAPLLGAWVLLGVATGVAEAGRQLEEHLRKGANASIEVSTV
jgi:O-antigen ligase